MHVYRIVCLGGVQYIRSRTMLDADGIRLFKACAAEARQASKDLDIRKILVNTIAEFNARARMGLEIAGNPWTATIEI